MMTDACSHPETYTDEYDTERCVDCGTPIPGFDVACRGGCGRTVDPDEHLSGMCPDCQAKADRRNQDPPRWRA